MTKSELKELLWTTFGNLPPIRLMALTIYGEARGESRAGKIGVGSVILERVDHRDWDGNTIHDVCLMPFQFSCFLPNDPNFHALKLIAENWNEKLTRSKDLRDCFNVAAGLINKTIDRVPEIARAHATQYKTTTCKAAWADKMKWICTVGRHSFYA